VQSGARLLVPRSRRLQIGAEMARALDDAVILAQPRRLVALERAFDIRFRL
jgi:hypothetical protein